MKKSAALLFFCCYTLVYACSPEPVPASGSRLWNNVIEDLVVDIITLSKIDDIESAIASLQNTSLTDMVSSELSIIESYVQDINQQTTSLESTVNNLSSFIAGPINSKLDLIEDSKLSIQSTVNVIDTRTNSIYSLDQIISSNIDIYSATEQSVLSQVMVIDSKIVHANLSCNDIPVALDLSKSIHSLVHVIDTRTESIYDTDQTILSLVEHIDEQNVTIISFIDDLDTYFRTTILSQLDLIEHSNQSIQSTVYDIDTRTDSIYNLDRSIASKIDVNTKTIVTTESLVHIINSELDTLNCIASLSDLAVSIDQSILSEIMVIDTRTTQIQSLTDQIFSLDQTIASNVQHIYQLDQTLLSQVDTLIAIDTSVQSTLDNIFSHIGNVACSNIGQLANLDQSITSIVHVIDTRTSAIQSNSGLIYSLDEVISSQVDAETRSDISIQSNLVQIESSLDTIQSNIETTYSLESLIYSAISALSTCCTTTGNQPMTSLYGSEVVANKLDNISVQFQYGIPTYSVTPYTQGGGTVTSANSMAVLSTAAAAGSIAQLQSNNTIVYRSGHEAYAYFSVAFTGSFAATSSQFIGPIDYQNGFAVGFNGATFGVTRRANTVNTFIPQSSFNGDKLDGTGPSGFTYNPALLNVFRIGYGYLGSSIIKFQISDSKGNWITFHIIPFPNSSSTPSILQPYLPVTARVENLTGTSTLTLQTASWNAGIVGQFNTSSYRYFQTNNQITPNAGGAETFVLTIRNKTVFNNQPNKIPVRISAFGGGALVRGGSIESVNNLRLRLNAVVTGTSFSDIDSSSVIQVSTTGTYSAGTGQELLTRSLGATSQAPTIPFIPQGVYDIILLPGNTLTITAQFVAGTNFLVIGGIAWEERF